MRNILFGVFLISLPALAVRGTYLGLRAGPVTLNNTQVLSSSGMGLDVGFRMTKAYDIVAQLQVSQSGAFSHWIPSVSGEMRIFRGMAELELSLGLGLGMYALSGIGDSELRPGINGGVTLDYVINRALHIGTTARYHTFGSDRYGSSMTIWMVRLGYYFSFVEDTSLPLSF